MVMDMFGGDLKIVVIAGKRQNILKVGGFWISAESVKNDEI
jgi:hypothetical protein